jgi:FixJ family two-component response regulator
MPSASTSPFVAIVDDDRSVQSALKDLMESAGLSARCFGSAEAFLEAGDRRQTACLIADIRMPGMSGLALQEKLRAEGSDIPIIVVTAHGDNKMKLRAMQAGAIGFLSKPFDDEVLLEKVRAALKS